MVWHRRVSHVLGIPRVASRLAHGHSRDITQLCEGDKGQLRGSPESCQPGPQLFSSISCSSFALTVLIHTFLPPSSHCFRAGHCHEASSIFTTGCQPTLAVASFELDTFTFYVGKDAIQQKGRKINICLFKTRLVVSKSTSGTSSYWLFHPPGQESTGFFMT